MNWFNYYGLIFVAVILIPNVIFAIKCKDGFENKWKNKAVETAEQIGRFGSFIFMIFNIPKTYFGFWFDGGFIAYIVVESVLAAIFSPCHILLSYKNAVAVGVPCKPIREITSSDRTTYPYHESLKR